MKRNSTTLNKELITNIVKLCPEFYNSGIQLKIDEANSNDIYSFLLFKKKNGKYKNIKKFTRILYTIMQYRYKDDLYGKEEVTNKAKDVTAMKFKGSNNFRIVCKELFSQNKIIVMSYLFHKKNQGNSKKEIAIYETVGGYEYEC